MLAANRLGRFTLAAVLTTALSAIGPPGHAHAATGSWLPETPDFWPVVVDQSHTPRVPVTHGVEACSETYDAVGGRQHTQVLDVDLGDHNVRVGAVAAHRPGTATVSVVSGGVTGRLTVTR